MSFIDEVNLIDFFESEPFDRDVSIGMLAFSFSRRGIDFLVSFSEIERWVQVKMLVGGECISQISSDLLEGTVIDTLVEKRLVFLINTGSFATKLFVDVGFTPHIMWDTVTAFQM